jgi:dTDP-4-dehydrorhamnose 3,5-epimerase
MEIRKLELPGVLLIQPKLHRDPRGYFFESFRTDTLAAAGVPPFVQDNQSMSTRGTLRGLHYQLDRPQGKLVRVLQGAVIDVVVDIRIGSPTFGRWLAEELSAENLRQVYVPPGYAHGFQVIGEVGEVFYKCTDYYSGAADQRGIAWNDPALAIPWPERQPLLSHKDTTWLPLDVSRADLPKYVP